MDQGSAEAKNRLMLIEQFAYFADELEAQELILHRIPASILEAVPYEGAVSIRNRYEALAVREDRHGEELSNMMGAAKETSASGAGPTDEKPSMLGLLGAISEKRRNLAERLRTIDASSWSTPVLADGGAVPLLTWVYRVVLGDADDLREIAVHFSEMQLQFGREI